MPSDFGRRKKRGAALVFMLIKDLKTRSRAVQRIFLLSGVACAITLTQARAQEAPLPKVDAQNPAAATEASATPAPSVPPPIVIPEDLVREPQDPPTALPDVPTIPELNDSFKPAPLSPTAQLHQLNVESRKLRNRVQNEAPIKAALAHAEAAPNDLEKRKRLAKYYDAYYGRMIALAATPELKKYIGERKTESLLGLKQPRVRPELLASVKAADPAAPKPAASAPPIPTTSPSPTPAGGSEPLSTSPFATPAPRSP